MNEKYLLFAMVKRKIMIAIVL
ncbi:Protein of unknown function [Bacillus cereus]|nr:Protein of unknown function [Bacillus cereus]SCN34598.1 Protein of unknown function [Bacillus wiedmannii]